MSLLIPGTNSIKDTGYNVANSLRFNGGSSDDLERTPSSSGNNTTNTVSVWLKRARVDEEDFIIYGEDGSTNRCKITFLNNNKLQINTVVSSSNSLVYETTRVFRDVGSWYHFVFAFDSTLSTAGDRFRLYINGTEETSFSTETHMGQNTSNTLSTSGKTVYIGSQNTGNYFDGYMAEFVFIDGQQLAPTSFGEFDADSPTIWKPIDVSGLTFGTNGFHLDFENASSLGADVSGNSNNFTVNNLTSVDQSTDTCTNNMPTINQLTLHSNNVTISEGSLKATTTDSPWQSTNCTFGLTTGKWYWEFKATESSSNQYLVLGIQSDNLLSSAANSFGFNNNYSYGMKLYDGQFVFNESDGGSSQSYGNAVTDGQIVGVALDLVNLKIYFSINGTYQNSGNPTSGSTGTGSPTTLQSGQIYFPALVIANNGGTPIGEYNFGSPPYSISSGNADANGFGNFEYSVPSGYFSLCTKNLAEFG